MAGTQHWLTNALEGADASNGVDLPSHVVALMSTLVISDPQPNDSHHGGDVRRLLIGLSLESASLASGIFGKQLLRLGHLRGSRSVRVLGVLLQTFCGPTLDAAAMAFAASSVLVLFGGLDAVGTLLVAPFLVGEPLTRQKVAGASFVTLGTMIAASCGPRGAREDKTLHPDQLHELFLQSSFTCWALLFAVVGAWGGYEIACRRNIGSTPRRGLAFGVVGGMCDGNSWCLKSVVRLVVAEQSIEVLASPLALLLVLGALGSALTALLLLMRGTREFETVFLVPVVDGARIVSGAACGFLVLHEGQDMPFGRWCGYMLAVLAVLGGIWILYRGEGSRQVRPDCGPIEQEIARNLDAPA